MDPNTTRKEIQELTIMAQAYYLRGMRDKAAELLDMISRLEKSETPEHNVIAMADYKTADAGGAQNPIEVCARTPQGRDLLPYFMNQIQLLWKQ